MKRFFAFLRVLISPSAVFREVLEGYHLAVSQAIFALLILSYFGFDYEVWGHAKPVLIAICKIPGLKETLSFLILAPLLHFVIRSASVSGKLRHLWTATCLVMTVKLLGRAIVFLPVWFNVIKSPKLREFWHNDLVVLFNFWFLVLWIMAIYSIYEWKLPEAGGSQNRVVIFLKSVLGLLRWILRTALGIDWTCPAWLKWILQKMVRSLLLGVSLVRKGVSDSPAKFAAKIVVTGVILGSGFFAYRWYIRQPHVAKIEISGTHPGATPVEDELKPDPVHLYFSASAARLEQMGRPVLEGIEINPSIKGQWRWVTDKELVFEPREDWGVGQFYKVKLDKKLFPEHVRLKDWIYTFRSAPFVADIANSEFYIDPKNPKIKMVIATVKFSHPVNPENFEKRTTLRLAGQNDGILGMGGENFHYTVTYNRFKTEAYLHSDNVEIPRSDTVMKITLDDGIQAVRGGKGTGERIARDVYIPGIFSFFRLQNAQLTLVRNERFEPEQVLVIQVTYGALEKTIQENLSVYLLPVDLPPIQGRPGSRNFRWGNTAIIGPEILAVSQKLALEPVPTDSEYATLHSFKYKAAPGRSLYVKINKGIESYGGFILEKDYDTLLTVPDFPRELKIMYDGSILSLSGEKKVSLFSRDVDAVRFEVARVLPGQINHLVSQSGGSFRSPYFNNYLFNSDNISERFSEVRQLAKLEHGKTQYFSFDLTEYLASSVDPGQRRGLFFFKAEGWDPVYNMPVGIEDRRLILVTDMGLLVKDSRDNTHNVFVQSILTGSPVNGAQVQIIGKNGLPVLTETTDEDGHVSFPALSNFGREKEPVVYIARKGSDLSFIPFNWGDRRLNLSRFDTGGVLTDAMGEGMTGYLFSDRGIYRPGEEFHIGIIVKSFDWKKQLAGIPLEVSLRDPRGLEIHKQKISLSAAGLMEYQYQTEDVSPTGNYEVSLYVVRDNQRSSLLGSVSVRVEEFLPDRMRISSRFSTEKTSGWVSPDDLQGRVSLQNMFGTPAESRRITAMITVAPSFPVFGPFKDYTFSDPMQAKRSFSDRLKDKTTDKNGEAVFDLGLDRFEKATYRLRLVVEGYELAGGRSVSSESSILVSPQKYLIGYKPDGDFQYVHKESARNVEIIAVNSDLQKVEARNLTASIYEQRYVSVLKLQPDGAYRYQSTLKETLTDKKEISVPDKGLLFPLPARKPGDYVIVIRDSIDTELSRIPFSVVGEANLARTLEKNAELQLKLNKSDYAPGEEIELQVTAPYTGAGIITIEKERVYTYKWFHTETTNSVQRIRIPEGMEGNGYVHVSFVRAMTSQEIFLSPLSYGVVPFSISRKMRTIGIQLQSPDLSRPGEPYRIRYKTDQPGKIMIFAVDEGILQVAGYKTPDPLSFFFKKRALEVQTFQILDLILPEFKILQELSAPGGDEGSAAIGKNLNPFKRKLQKAVAYWSGIVDADETERELVYDVPDHFGGSLRVMAVAVSQKAIGVSEKRSIVRGHFVINPNVPAFVAPGDTFDVTVAVSNNVEGSGKNFPVNLELKVSPHLELADSPKRSVGIDEGRETSMSFKLRAKTILGSANLTFLASSGNKKSKLSVDLSVRPPVPYRTTTSGGYVQSGKSGVPTPRKLYPQHRVLSVAASPLPLALADGLVCYLNNYPYGCTEQLVSQAFAELVMIRRPEFGKTNIKLKSRVDQAFNILRARQNDDGAFGFWAANSHVSEFQTVYALHFLTEAKERGLPVPREVLTRGIGHLIRLCASDFNSLAEARVRAYALYILIRNGHVATPHLNALLSQARSKLGDTWKTDLTGAYISAGMKLLKLDREADSLMLGLPFGASMEPDYDNCYDGLVRDAQHLYLLSKHFPGFVAGTEAKSVLHIVDPILKGSYNTVSSAYSILAMDSYGSVVGAPNPGNVALREQLPDNFWRPLKMSGGMFVRADFSDQAKSVEVKNEADHTLFFQVTQAGYDTDPPARAVKEKLEIYREYRDEAGKAISNVKLGEQVFVHLKVRGMSGGGHRNIVVVDLLPGGFEVVSESVHAGQAAPPPPVTRSEDDESESSEQSSVAAKRDPENRSSSNQWQTEFVDAREDRVLLFGPVEDEAAEYVYRIKATNKGTYSVPPIFCESMYDRALQGLGLGGQLIVE